MNNEIKEDILNIEELQEMYDNIYKKEQLDEAKEEYWSNVIYSKHKR